MTGYPFGPGGYGGCFEPHFLRSTTIAIAVTTTAKAEPAYFSGIDMRDGEEGDDGKCLLSKMLGIQLPRVMAPHLA